MTLALEYPPCVDSPLGSVDARWKLVALLIAVFSVPWLQTLPAAAVEFILALTLAGFARLPWAWYTVRVGVVLFFVALFVIWIPFTHDQAPYWLVGPIELSLPGFLVATLLLIKAVTIVTLVLVLWATAPFEVTLKAAHAVKIPGLLLQLFVLTYRYTFLLGDEFNRLRVALRLRGFRNRPNVHSYRTIGHVSGILLVRGYERAERVGQAMRCRGFDGQFRALSDFRTRTLDVAIFLLIIVAVTGILVMDVWLR